MKKRFLVFIISVNLVMPVFAGYANSYYCASSYYNQRKNVSQIKIQDFNFDRDAEMVKELFNEEDNWHWLISEEYHDYSVDHMLRYRSSSNVTKNNDLTLKVMKKNEKLVGFAAYCQKSSLV